MIIGFSQRSQTVIEMSTLLMLNVHSLRLSELDYEVRLRHLSSCSTASIGKFMFPFSGPYDAYFGARKGSETNLNVSLDALEISVVMFSGSPARIPTIVTDDLLHEEDECYTIRILSPSIGLHETYACNEDYDNPNDFFCLHTICIEDNDPTGLHIIVKWYTLYMLSSCYIV